MSNQPDVIVFNTIEGYNTKRMLPTTPIAGVLNDYQSDTLIFFVGTEKHVGFYSPQTSRMDWKSYNADKSFKTTDVSYWLYLPDLGDLNYFLEKNK